MIRVVQHVFGEVALLAIGTFVVVVALHVAVVAAGDIWLRARRDGAVCLAERVVVDIECAVLSGRLSPFQAAGEQRRRQQQREEQTGETASHANILNFSSSTKLPLSP